MHLHQPQIKLNVREDPTLNSSKRLQLIGLMLTSAAAASGCGGGGGGGPAESAPSPSISMLQGVWEGSVVSGAQTLSASALVRSDGRTWLAITDTRDTANTDDDSTRLLHASFAVSGSGFAATGQDYVLGSSIVRGVSLATTAVQVGSSIAGTLTGAASERFSLSYQSRYDAAAALSNFTGMWRSSLGTGAVTVDWTVTVLGAISGTSTTGCNYSGEIALRADAKAIADATLTEICPGTTTVYGGAAIYNPNTAHATLALTMANDTSALILRWVR